VYALHQHLVQQDVSLDGWVGCEVWVRRQVMGAGVTTHYDLDIGRKRHDNSEHVPYLSSILYLPATPPPPATTTTPTAPPPFSPGPTFILDTRHDLQKKQEKEKGQAVHTSPPTRAEVVWPRAGRYAIFDGQLAHGVLPCAAARLEEAGADAGEAVRFTMLINWWRQKPAAPECRPISEAALHEVQQAVRVALREAAQRRQGAGFLKSFQLSSAVRSKGARAELVTVKESDKHGLWTNGCESRLGGVTRASAVPVPCPEFPPPQQHSGLVRLVF
jgi:hypothetical protein